MASLQSNCDISGLSEEQNQFIRNVLEKRGFINNKVILEKVKGSDFCSFIRVIVEVENGEDFKLIAKIAPANVKSRHENTNLFFSNERAMYLQVLLKFSKIQSAVHLPEEEKFKCPVCYGCLSEEPNEVVLLEELSLNYVPGKAPLNNDSIKLLIKKFARIHSLSFATKKNEPGIFEILKSKLVNIRGIENETPEFKALLNNVESIAIKMLDDEKYIKAMRYLADQMSIQFSKIKTYEISSKHQIILKGEAEIENILFKFEDDKPLDCIMTNYQMSKEGNPAEDILYMAFNYTDHATRVNHYGDWIDYYHDQLDQSLSDLGMKANFVYTRDQLGTDLKRYSILYFITSVTNLYNSLTRRLNQAEKTELQSDVEESKLNDDDAKILKSKIEDLVDSYKEFGYM